MSELETRGEREREMERVEFQKCFISQFALSQSDGQPLVLKHVSAMELSLVRTSVVEVLDNLVALKTPPA